MNDFDYEAYLKSEAWRKVANERLKIDHFTCVMCGSHGSPENPLETHHFNYRNLGHENPWLDLVTLCHTCHTLVTRLMNRVIDENGSRGWNNKAIPRITVYTISGSYLESRKENTQTNVKGNTKEL